MSKELRELLNQLDSKNKELNSLLNKDGVTAEELNKTSNEIDILQAKIEAQKRKENIENNFNEDNVKSLNTGKEENVIYNGALFVRAIADNLLKQKNQRGLNLSEKEINAISENIDEDGGYAVPEDIQTKINTRLKDTTDLYNMVDYEPVFTRSGSRTYEKRSKQKPMKPLSENQQIPTNGDNGKLERFNFKLKDLADFMSIPNDLLKFADKSLEDWIINWFVDKVRITRNAEILYGAGGDEHATGIMTANKFKKITLPKSPALKDFKKCKNVELLNVFKATSSWIVNQDGFNYLDSLEDKTGRPYLQPDPKDPTQYRFLGLPVIELPNDLLLSTESAIPVLLGDTKEAYKYVSDGAYELATTNIGAGAFETNTTKARIIMRIDGNVKDSEALLIAEIPVESVQA
ncbi:TPA: phage major capsid protein [Clostridium perfringens]|uniref:major head protein n=1 Tax=Clostridium phage phiSM101 TaxID=396359 RepID=UPI0000DB6814|nr:phage major capsid protein [Clostridium perfringens]YP_699941.1 major head protein [Clostridium phage phiSM101]ABG87920.1 phage major capsid protein, HK97 family [Clostridium phage phiSM101]MCH1961289.1 phage major capsid protein [Clostridium perfringens]MDM0731949.1 phage major capsid protein [Clostridium perfringens]UBL09406.1 phage major capsid protein [Clostridium perfringens]SQB59764.1 phage major capsid protein, HK97 family [Clostridium perfringens]